MSKKPPRPWPNLQHLIDNGANVSLGALHPIPCAAVAADEHTMYAALMGRDGESVVDLLTRLDAALEIAFTQNVYTDEING